MVEAAIAIRPLTRADFKHGLTLLGLRMGFWQWGNLWRIFNVAGSVSPRRWYEVICGKPSNGGTCSALGSRPKPLRKPTSLIQRLDNEITAHRLRSFKFVIDNLNAACKRKRQHLFTIALEVTAFLQKNTDKSEGSASSRRFVRIKRLAKAAMSTVVANQVDFLGIGAESPKVQTSVLSSNHRSDLTYLEYRQITSIYTWSYQATTHA